MNLAIISIFDVAVGAYNRPFFAPSRGAALRSFQDEVNRASPDNLMHGHPGDFQLVLFGSFDDVSGVFTLLPVPERIALGSDVRTV